MSDSLLIEALSNAREVLDELNDEDALGVRELRARARLIERAAALLELRPASREDIVRMAKLTMELRDDAVELRRRHRVVRHELHAMMD